MLLPSSLFDFRAVSCRVVPCRDGMTFMNAVVIGCRLSVPRFNCRRMRHAMPCHASSRVETNMSSIFVKSIPPSISIYHHYRRRRRHFRNGSGTVLYENNDLMHAHRLRYWHCYLRYCFSCCFPIVFVCRCNHM